MGVYLYRATLEGGLIDRVSKQCYDKYNNRL